MHLLFLQTEVTELCHLTEEKAALLDQLKVEKATLLDKCSALESQLQDVKVCKYIVQHTV